MYEPIIKLTVNQERLYTEQNCQLYCTSILLMNLRWLPRVIVKQPPYRARVRKGNVVNSA